MQLQSDSFAEGATIPGEFAFAVIEAFPVGPPVLRPVAALASPLPIDNVPGN